MLPNVRRSSLLRCEFLSPRLCQSHLVFLDAGLPSLFPLISPRFPPPSFFCTIASRSSSPSEKCDKQPRRRSLPVRSAREQETAVKRARTETAAKRHPKKQKKQRNENEGKSSVGR
ncbi:hypothetical protein TGMAS_415050 [Toxoplasma gondii MAS]|uniref:Uncharacterized protein n=1 Tax=Toxoplasma gondii MAS TaxID=943118 RepID=A0A086QES3_TOXGO|nr:hypothetical protein TGMAS_415050 [Toxoplasma gondii MAS]